ncbi:hypothetical protein K438DRAFT_1927365 [Mycena galopus ATCC 62051]|nr:hypothetical protein K438DRAFT_1927365 [Mycena galopus ATCC 62051]
MQFLLVLLAAATAVSPALAQVTSWANIGCTGASSVAACDGSCQSFIGKRAFSTPAGAEVCVTMFLDASCTTVAFPNPNQDGECTAIESGNPILAYSCSSDNVCA